MKFELKIKDLNKAKDLIDRNELNIMSANMYLDFIENYPHVFTNSNDNYIEKFLENLDIDQEDKDNEIFINDYIRNNITKMKIEDFLSNEYVKTVTPKECKINKIQLKYLSYKPYETFISDDIFVDDDFIEKSRLGYFEKEYKYLSLIENNNIWMLISPNEINTMKKHIENAHGNVLVLGLGLGYYSYMISNKKDVKSITIIENNKSIIDIFKMHIMPFFNTKTPINIIYGDAFDCLKYASKYDFVFSDLWHNPNDGLELYLKIKQQEIINENTEFSYWLETGILALLRRCLITLIDEEIHGSKDSQYLKSETITDVVINKLHDILKTTKISNFDEIKKLLSDDSLKSLATKIKI